MSTQDAQKRLLYLHRENARLRRRIMAAAVTSDEAASSVANLAQSLADARAEVDRLHGAVCQAVALLNRAPEVAQCTEGRQAHTILREVLVLHADNAGPNVISANLPQGDELAQRWG